MPVPTRFTPSRMPQTLAIDRFSNLWYGRGSSSGTNLVFQLPYTGTYGAPAVIENTSLTLNNQMIVDSNDNVWISNSTTGTSKLYEIYNTGTVGTPLTLRPTASSPLHLAVPKNGGLGIDSACQIWTGYASNTAEYTPTGSGSGTAFNTATAAPPPPRLGPSSAKSMAAASTGTEVSRPHSLQAASSRSTRPRPSSTAPQLPLTTRVSSAPAISSTEAAHATPPCSADPSSRRWATPRPFRLIVPAPSGSLPTSPVRYPAVWSCRFSASELPPGLCTPMASSGQSLTKRSISN